MSTDGARDAQRITDLPEPPASLASTTSASEQEAAVRGGVKTGIALATPNQPPEPYDAGAVKGGALPLVFPEQ